MALLVDDSAPEWVFSSSKNGSVSRHAAHWHQLTDSSVADTAGYYNGTALWTNSTDASATLIFQGVQIILYSAKMPQGGQMNVTCDWESKVVDLRSDTRDGSMEVWHADNLNTTTVHAVKIQKIGGGIINIDQVIIYPGSPSAFPPVMPRPLPPAFPNVRAVTPTLSTVTSTMTMTMTMAATTEPNEKSSDVSLSRGAAVGVAIGIVAATLIAAFLFMLCRRRRKRDGKSLGERGLHLPRWISRRGYRSPGNSAPSFMNDNREKAGGEMQEQVGAGVHGGSPNLLPSIRRPSTMYLDRITVSTPSPSILAQFSPPPSRPSYSPTHSHLRNHSFAMTLGINTDVESMTKSTHMRSARTRSSSQSQSILTVHRRPSDGFASNLTDEWYELNYGEDVPSIRGELDDAAYYAGHFSSRSDQGLVEEQDVAAYIEEPDNISPDTPLLPRSPAMASSNASLSHHDSDRSRTSHFSKGNKILRSLHSHPSKRSSLRRSFGKPSRRSSSNRTSVARTPVSKTSTSTSASESPRSERHNTRRSTLSMSSFPMLTVAEAADPSVVAPPIPSVSGIASLPLPLHPPSSWESVPSFRKVIAKLPRLQRPAGPRTRDRSASIASIQTNSSFDGCTHGWESPRSERGEMLSVVAEGSKSGSSRTSF